MKVFENPNGKSRIKWSQQEEKFIKHLKENEMIDSWKEISKRLNSLVQGKGRTGKQCRERYMNFLRFGEETPKIVGWTPTQDQRLFQQFTKVGPKWSYISKQMKERSENCIKNRFHGLMRKTLRRITKCQKQLRIKQKKPIKNGNLVQILRGINRDNFSQGRLSLLNQNQVIFIERLKMDLIQYVLQHQVQPPKTETFAIIQKIHRYNMIMRESTTKKKNQNSHLNIQTNKILDQNRFSKQSDSNSFYPTGKNPEEQFFELGCDIQSLIEINQVVYKQMLPQKLEKQTNLFELLNQQFRDSLSLEHIRLLL